jgi:hypothetical protein
MQICLPFIFRFHSLISYIINKFCCILERYHCNCRTRTSHSPNGMWVVWGVLGNVGVVARYLHILQRHSSKLGWLSEQEQDVVCVSIFGSAGLWLKMGLLGNLVLLLCMYAKSLSVLR